MGVQIDDGFIGGSGDKPSDDRAESRPSSAASQLVGLAMERYHFGISEDGQPYAVRPGQHVVRMLLGGQGSLQAELSREYHRKYKKVAPQQALADALLVLEGEAQDQDPDRVYLRVAKADGAIWLDMGDVAETVIRIDRHGWDIVQDSVPILFRRTALSSPMAAGLAGLAGIKYRQTLGDIERLWDHLSVSPADRPLVLAWLIAAFIPDIPHPILALLGEQGTGKSTASRRLVSIVDPSPVPLRKPPRDQESWVTAAQGSWVVGLDNLSYVPDWLSDSLCRAATGDGDVRRALYTDSGLAVFAFRRCVLLNGIDVGALRGDLADRIVKINLDRIPDEKRQDEEELEPEWEAAYASILASLFAGLAGVMGLLPSLRLASKPRMADFARVLAAVDQLLGTDGLGRYAEQARTMAEDTLSANSLISRMREMRLHFTGRASELLIKVTPDADRWRPPRDWPKDPRVVTSILRRNAPALRKTGWVVEEAEDLHDGIIVWTVIHPEFARISGPQGPQGPQDAGTAGTAGSKYGSSLGEIGAGADISGEGAQPPFYTCQVCQVAGLWAPQSQQRGVCEACWRKSQDGAA